MQPTEMESYLGERLIGEKQFTLAKSPSPANLYEDEAAAAIAKFNQEKFRLAFLITKSALRFRNGIDDFDLGINQDREETERTEEANIGSRYYYHQCVDPLDVNMSRPLYQGCFIEERGAGSSLHPGVPSNSEPCASDSDGNGAMQILPSDQTVPDMVENSNGIDDFDLGISINQDREETERTEEANVGSRYYCHQCVDPLDVNMSRPLYQGCFIEERGAGSSLHPGVPSNSEPCASDSDGNGAMQILPSDQTVPDMVENSNGSAQNRSPIDTRGPHEFDKDGDSHQALGHNDSTVSRSLLPGDGSDAVTNNSVPGHGGISSSNSTVSHPLSSGANGGPDQPHQGTRIASWIWIFSAGFGLEAVMAIFDQVATPHKPQYAFYGMLLSVVAVLLCVWDLISIVIKQGRIASESNILWRIFPEVCGLVLACVQCISSTLQFSFHYRHVPYPVKVSPVLLLVFFILFGFKYRYERNYCRRNENSQQV